MYKRIICGILSAAVLLGMAGCASKTDGPVESSAKDERTVFEQVEDGLTDAGIKFEKTVMAAEMVGAVEGQKYKLSTGNVEVYRFEKDSDALKDAKSSGTLTLKDYGSFEAEINGNYAFLNETTGDEYEKVAEIISKLINLK